MSLHNVLSTNVSTTYKSRDMKKPSLDFTIIFFRQVRCF